MGHRHSLSRSDWFLVILCALMLATVIYYELRGPLPYCWTVRAPRNDEPAVVYGLGRLQTKPGECAQFEFVPIERSIKW